MALSRSFQLDMIKSNYMYADGDLVEAQADISFYMTHKDDANVIYYHWFIGKAVEHLIDAVDRICAYNSPVGGQSLVPNFLAVHTIGDLDLDAILSAMVVADPNQVMYFIGLVDAYRQSVWNRPFNQEFFAALARGFTQWP